MPRHVGGEADHLAHPRARLRSREVGAHAGPKVLGLPDVEDPAAVVGEDVDARRVWELVREVALAPLGRRHPRAERRQLLERVDAQRAEAFEQPVQHIDRGARVGERAVGGRGRRAEVGREGGEPAVGRVVAAEDAPGEQRGVDDRERGPVEAVGGRRGAEEPDVERRVVGHENAALGELQERRQGLADRGRARDHRIGDAGEDGDERGDRLARLDQGLELAEHLTRAHLHRADLGDAVGLVGSTRGLEVDHAERHVPQERAELVEAGLHSREATRRGGGPTRGKVTGRGDTRRGGRAAGGRLGGHDFDATAAHRHAGRATRRRGRSQPCVRRILDCPCGRFSQSAMNCPRRPWRSASPISVSVR